MSHRSVIVHVMLRIRVHLIVMMLEVVISWLFEVLHAEYRSDPGVKLEDDCTCQSPSLVVQATDPDLTGLQTVQRQKLF